jgi:hypothetical protein
MTQPSPKTRFDKLILGVKNHRLLSILLFIGVAIMAVSKFWDSVERFLPWQSPETSSHVAAGIQEGEITVSGFDVYDVFYPNPYASTPNLVFPSGTESVGAFKVVEQRPDGFKASIGSYATMGTKIKWKATGSIASSTE